MASNSKAGTQSIPQTGSGTKSVNGNQRSFKRSPSSNYAGNMKPTQNNSYIARSDSNSSPPKPLDENPAGGLNDESYNGNDDDNSWVSPGNYNRKRGGQNSSLRGNGRGTPRDSNTNYQNGRRNPRNSNGHEDSGNWYPNRQSFRGRGNFVSNGRGQGRSQVSDFNGTRNQSNCNANSTISSPNDGGESENQMVQKNAWHNNATTKAKSFENPVLKSLLPKSEKEEQEMVQLAMKLSLEVESHNSTLVIQPAERKSSDSSEMDTSFDPVAEAKKMLQSKDFLPLPASDPIVLSTKIIATMAPASEGKHHIPIDAPVMDQMCNGLDRSSPEDWDRLGARPKEKTPLPIGRGAGRGKRGSEGKIGELIAKPTPRVMKPVRVSSEISSEQFEMADVSPSVTNEEVVVDANEKSITKTVESQTQCDILPKKVSTAEKLEESLMEKKDVTITESSAKEPEPELIETPGSIAIREVQSLTESSVKASELSKDEQIRALKAELHRLSNRDPVPSYPPPSYGVPVPINMVPAVPMSYSSYYRFPYPAMAVPVDPGCMQYAAPIQQNVHMIYPPNTYALQQNIPNPCLNAASFSSPPPNEFLSANNYSSRLSPNAAEFVPSHSNMRNEQVQRGNQYSDYHEEGTYSYRQHQQRVKPHMSRGMSRPTRGQYNNYSTRGPINSVNESNYYTPPPFPNRRPINHTRTGSDMYYNQEYSY